MIIYIFRLIFSLSFIVLNRKKILDFEKKIISSEINMCSKNCDE